MESNWCCQSQVMAYRTKIVSNVSQGAFVLTICCYHVDWLVVKQACLFYKHDLLRGIHSHSIVIATYLMTHAFSNNWCLFRQGSTRWRIQRPFLNPDFFVDPLYVPRVFSRHAEARSPQLPQDPSLWEQVCGGDPYLRALIHRPVLSQCRLFTTTLNVTRVKIDF